MSVAERSSGDLTIGKFDILATSTYARAPLRPYEPAWFSRCGRTHAETSAVNGNRDMDHIRGDE